MAAARGLQRSGLSQALAAQGAQSGAQVAADTAADMAARRRAAQLQALSQMGALGGNVRGADYRQAADAAEAQDAINKFNANMRAGALEARNQLAQRQYANAMQMKTSRNAARGDLANWYTDRGNRNNQTAQDIGAGIQGGAQSGADYMERTKKPKGGR
jgi:hypothetical protein